MMRAADLVRAQPGVLRTLRALGLVVVADAPRTRPKPRKDLLRLLCGDEPTLWDLPWVEARRLGDPADRLATTSAHAWLAQDVNHIISEDARA